jgi:hypothetical protein
VTPLTTPPTAAWRVNQQPVRQREFHEASSTGEANSAPSRRRAAVRSTSRSGSSSDAAATSGRTAKNTGSSMMPSKPASGRRKL